MSNEPKVIKVILIRQISGHRFECVGEVLRRNDGSVIKLGGIRFCTGMSKGIEVFDIECFTDEELVKILDGSDDKQ